MKRKRKFQGTDKQHDGTCVCPTCGEDMRDPHTGRLDFWHMRQGPPPVPIHCAGSPVAALKPGISIPHHGRRRHPDCWQCGQPMGCDQCVSSRETLCLRCACYVYPAQLARLGAIVNDQFAVARRHGLRAPQVEDYPADFQQAYHAFHHACPPDCWHRMAGSHRAAVAAYLDQLKVPPAVEVPDAEKAAAARDLLHRQLDLLTQQETSGNLE